MPVVDQLLTLLLNHLLWVIWGLASWVCAFAQLYRVRSDVFGDAVTLTFSVLPLGITVITFIEAFQRRNGNTRYQAILFALASLASLIYFGWLYVGDSKVRKLIRERKVLTQSPGRTVRVLFKLLLGAISVLGSVALLIVGGWELIHASVTTGWVLFAIGIVLWFLQNHPKWPVNWVWQGYSALTKSREKVGQTAV